jgi:hypothetical protein
MLFHNLNSTAEKSDFFFKSFREVPLYMDIYSFKYWTALYSYTNIQSKKIYQVYGSPIFERIYVHIQRHLPEAFKEKI